MRVRVATRGSKLSLIQAEMLMGALRRLERDISFEVVVVRTTGDAVQDKPLYAIGVKGVFEREVNMALLRGEADIAVHSLKDLPSAFTPGLKIAWYSPRDPPLDVLATRDGKDLWGLPPGAVVGTSSVRRREFLRHVRGDLRVEVVRGNVDTRIGKLLDGRYDALVLAEAGLVRLYGGSSPARYTRLDPRVVPPALGQGIVVGVVKEGEGWLEDLLYRASDARARTEAIAERTFMGEVAAGCHTAVGGIATAEGERVSMYAAAMVEGRKVEVHAASDDPRDAGRRAAEILIKEAGALGRW